jgi:hypothetical protein
MPALGAPLDFAKYEGRNFRAHILGAAPGSPVTGQLYYDSGVNKLFWYNGTSWIDATGGGTPADATTSTKGIVQLAGDLTGTAASPQIAALAVTDAEVATANKDGTAGVASMRTLGAGAQQAAAGNHTLNSHPAPVAALSMNSQLISSLATPVSGTDAATKAYVDSVAAGLSPKTAVRAATTANVATLAGGAPNVIDGVTLVLNDRVLVKNQTTTNQNGIYTVTTVGTGANGTWARASDMDAWAEVPSAYTFVSEGTTLADTGWTSTADAGGTLGTTAITWVQFTGAGQITDGIGLLKTGNTLDVRLDGTSIEAPADILQVKALGITNAMLAGSIDVTTKITGAVPVANGGTGQTTAKAARETGLSGAGYYTNGATHGAGATITITQATHGLRSSRGIIVQVQDEASGAVEFPDVVVAASGDVTVTYGASLTANTKRVTLIG